MRSVLLILTLILCSLACNIIVHVKSDTDKKFSAQVTASNGKTSDKYAVGKNIDMLEIIINTCLFIYYHITFKTWMYTKKLQKNTFQQKADECGLSDWEIATFYDDGKPAHTVNVTLDGIGRVTYKVGDDLRPVQKDRQGAICKGECAPL
ncbi:hypothetical protein DICVIV_02288 [Dictyocaulus viviparus]|uniref:Uncharacterized protein n=1 Tax=Dictyocaulus viviparus TaxID=29172 RepID=A0A0D8YAD8_DICVI|nr:hypothetical protein DICVIV_02288 [Dictyocaulus viviparus]